MATPTKIVVYFDDGTSKEINVRGMSSVFFEQESAVRCGHRPPYKQGPPNGGRSLANGTVTLMAAADDGDDESRSGGGSCYWIDGVIVCP